MPLPSVPITATTPTTPRLPFFEKFKAQQPPPESPELMPAARPLSPPSDSDSEYGGLAYADDDDDLDDNLPSPKLQPIGTTVPEQAGPSSGGKIRFPSMASESQYSVATSPTSPLMPRRTLSDSRASRGPAKSTGALDRVMETLFEEGASPLSSPPPKTAPLALEGQRDSVSRPPKLPVRSHTSPTLGKAGKTSNRQKERACAKCAKVIEDGRWIQMEGGSVLCDRCWKNMYLPKVSLFLDMPKDVCLTTGIVSCSADGVIRLLRSKRCPLLMASSKASTTASALIATSAMCVVHPLLPPPTRILT